MGMDRNRNKRGNSGITPTICFFSLLILGMVYQLWVAFCVQSEWQLCRHFWETVFFDLHMVSCIKIVLVSGRLFLLPKSCVSSMESTDWSSSFGKAWPARRPIALTCTAVTWGGTSEKTPGRGSNFGVLCIFMVALGTSVPSAHPWQSWEETPGTRKTFGGWMWKIQVDGMFIDSPYTRTLHHKHSQWWSSRS